jgi:hypothetical protein
VSNSGFGFLSAAGDSRTGPFIVSALNVLNPEARDEPCAPVLGLRFCQKAGTITALAVDLNLVLVAAYTYRTIVQCINEQLSRVRIGRMRLCALGKPFPLFLTCVARIN